MTGPTADTSLQIRHTAITRADHLPQIMSTALVGLKDNTSKLLHTLWINHPTVPIPVHTKVPMVPADPKGLHHNNLLMANHRMDKAIKTRLDLEGAMATKVIFRGFHYALDFVQSWNREKEMKTVNRVIIKSDREGRLYICRDELNIVHEILVCICEISLRAVPTCSGFTKVNNRQERSHYRSCFLGKVSSRTHVITFVSNHCK